MFLVFSFLPGLTQDQQVESQTKEVQQKEAQVSTRLSRNANHRK